MGLEGVIVTPVSKHAMARRRAVLSLLQNHKVVDDNNVDEAIAAAIRAETRVAGWYAQVLAQAAWQSNQS